MPKRNKHYSAYHLLPRTKPYVLVDGVNMILVVYVVIMHGQNIVIN